MKEVIKKMISEAIKKANVSKVDQKKMEKEIEFYIIDLQKNSNINLDIKLEEFVISRR